MKRGDAVYCCGRRVVTIGVAGLAALCGWSEPVGSQVPQATTGGQPTVAVMEFRGGALTRNSDYASLGAGLTELLSTSLATNASVRVVDRARLREIVNEQMLNSSDVTDASGAQMGRAVGANHFVTGGYIETNGRLRIDVRSINVETSIVEYRESVEGATSAVFALVDDLERRIAVGLHLAPSRLAQRRQEHAPKGVDQSRALALLGRAISAADRRDTAAAVAAAKQALEVYPEFGRAREFLATLQQSRTPH